MNNIIKLNIDVTKLDKTRFHKGKKGIYANLTVLLRDETDQYGNDGMIVQDVSKDERQAGVKGAIVGNARVNVSQQSQQPQRRAAPAASPVDRFDDEDEIPF